MAGRQTSSLVNRQELAGVQSPLAARPVQIRLHEVCYLRNSRHTKAEFSWTRSQRDRKGMTSGVRVPAHTWRKASTIQAGCMDRVNRHHQHGTQIR